MMAALGACALLGLTVGCSNDDDGAESSGTTPAGASVIDVELEEFTLALSTAEVASGPVTINATNAGTVEHELVIIRSDLDSGALPVVDGRVPEDEVDAVDEIAEFAAGTTESATFELDAGSYVLICNIPAHYSQGMHAALTVTD